jgi:hypothetical protein
MTEQSSRKQQARGDLEAKLQAAYDALPDDEQTTQALRSQAEVQGYGGSAGDAVTPINAVRWAYSRLGGLS